MPCTSGSWSLSVLLRSLHVKRRLQALDHNRALEVRVSQFMSLFSTFQPDLFVAPFHVMTV